MNYSANTKLKPYISRDGTEVFDRFLNYIYNTTYEYMGTISH